MHNIFRRTIWISAAKRNWVVLQKHKSVRNNLRMPKDIVASGCLPLLDRSSEYFSRKEGESRIYVLMLSPSIALKTLYENFSDKFQLQNVKHSNQWLTWERPFRFIWKHPRNFHVGIRIISISISLFVSVPCCYLNQTEYRVHKNIIRIKNCPVSCQPQTYFRSVLHNESKHV